MIPTAKAVQVPPVNPVHVSPQPAASHSTQENHECVDRCSHTRYLDAASATCLPCHPSCHQRRESQLPVCSGPSEHPGPGGCNTCQKFLEFISFDGRSEGKCSFVHLFIPETATVESVRKTQSLYDNKWCLRGTMPPLVAHGKCQTFGERQMQAQADVVIAVNAGLNIPRNRGVVKFF